MNLNQYLDIEDKKYLTWFVLVLFALGILTTNAYFGITLSDDAFRFISRGDALAEWLSAERTAGELPPKTWSFLIPNLVSAIGASISRENLPTIFAFVNITAYLLVAMLIWRLWVHENTVKFGLVYAFFTTYLYFGLPAETAKFALQSISSDMLSVLFQTAFLFFLFNAVTKGAPRSWTWVVVFAALSLITRPTGITVTFVLIASIVYLKIRELRHDRYGNAIGIAVVFLTPALLVFLVWPFLVFAAANDAGWAAALISPLPNWVPGIVHNGVVIKGASETWLSPPASYLEHVSVILHRFFYYVVPLRPNYSLPHILLNAVYIFVLVAAGIAGWNNLRKRGPAYGKAATLMLLCSLYFALIYSMLLVGHWRYSLSFWPGLWIIAGFSFVRLPDR